MVSALCFWLCCGCLLAAWATFWLPNYPKQQELTPGAVAVVYSLLFVLGPLLIAYMAVVNGPDFIRWVFRK